MAASTVRIDSGDHLALKELAGHMGVSMNEVLHHALQRLRREFILESTNSAYAAMKIDPAAWSAENRERGEWDKTSADALGDA